MGHKERERERRRIIGDGGPRNSRGTRRNTLSRRLGYSRASALTQRCRIAFLSRLATQRRNRVADEKKKKESASIESTLSDLESRTYISFFPRRDEKKSSRSLSSFRAGDFDGTGGFRRDEFRGDAGGSLFSPPRYLCLSAT